jgi:hypothetical protein
MARKRGKVSRQPALNGMEPVFIPELCEAVENYDDAMRERCKLSKEESDAKDALTEAMVRHKTKRYESRGGLIATLNEKSSVVVKKKKDVEGASVD